MIAIESFHDGGAEINAIRLANEFSRHSGNIYFLELYSELTINKRQKKFLSRNVHLLQPDLNWRIRPLNIAIKYTPFLKYRVKWVRDYIKARFLRKYFKDCNIKIVNSHHIQSDLYFSSFIKNTEAQLVSTFHGHYELYRNKWDPIMVEKQYKKVFSSLDHVVYTSQKHLDTLNIFKYPKERASKINYGFESLANASPTNYEKGSPLKICIISRALKEKGWEELINAVISHNKNHREKVILGLVGDGPFLNELISKYGSNPSITFHGHQDNINKYLNRTHIAALPSYFEAESMPNSVIEYLSHGKPVVATDNGAIKKMITHNSEIAGQIITIKDGSVAIDEISDAIRNYIINPDLVNKHSQIALKAFTKFDISESKRLYTDVFKKLIPGSKIGK